MRKPAIAVAAITLGFLLAGCPGPGTAHAQDKCDTNTQGVCTAEPIGTDPDASVNVNPAVTDPTVAHFEAEKICVLPNSCPNG